jgi:hypothetical protein
MRAPAASLLTRRGPDTGTPAGRIWTLPLLALLLGAWTAAAQAQIDFEGEPINYEKAPTTNPVSRLQESLDSGEVALDYDAERGYLPALLELLQVNPSSQVLVHSKTSFQLHRISPKRPRALYFNDDSYIGWVQGGDVIEIMTMDPQQGAMFYTISQDRQEAPQFQRDKGQCLTCHASSRTQGVPGGLVRSVFVESSGQPRFGSGTFTIDHRSRFDERWGGWYVTGTHGTMRHMGNVVLEKRQDPETLDREAGANVTDLAGLLETAPYLTPHSDIVALMVLEHQAQMQNFFTRANYEYRSAAHYDGIMNAALDRPDDYISDSTKRRVISAGDNLLRYLLFADEFPLSSPVKGTSDFAEVFEQQGPRDSQNRSLRELDLQTRMFKYPCSYLIYSPAFDELPETVKRYVARRLHDILAGRDTSGEFDHLTSADRQAILEILTDTKPELWEL